MLINMRNAMLAGKRLPYDAEVEYLQCNHTAWIDSGYHVTSDTRFEITFRYTRTDLNQARICDINIDNAANLMFAVYRNGNSKLAWSWANNRGNWAPIADIDTLKHKLVMDGILSKLFVTNIDNADYEAAITTTRTNTANQSLYIGNSRRTDFGNIIPYAEIYGWKISRAGNVVQDVIPVRFTNELGQTEGAMYDRANPTVGMNPDGSARTDGLYRNRGTGAFTIGPDI